MRHDDGAAAKTRPGQFRSATQLSRLDRPWVAVVLALAIGAAFVLLRLWTVANGNLARFIVVGSDHVLNPSLLPDGVPVDPGAGYDGQFYYRMALEPYDLSLGDSDDAIRLDVGIRRSRIGYPLLAWFASAGQAALVPYALVLVNLVALGLGAGAGAVLARSAGHHSLWGLLAVAYPGLLASLSRDTTEPAAIAFLLMGLAALIRGRFGFAAAALAAGALCRETALLLPLALLLSRSPAFIRRRGRPAQVDLAWAVPAAVWTMWQAVNVVRYGDLSISSGQGNADTFGRAAGEAIGQWIAAPTAARLLALFLVSGLVGMIALGSVSFRAPNSAPVQGLALVLSVILVLSLSAFVWNGDISQFRAFAEVHVLAATCIYAVRRRVVLLTAAVVSGACWLPVAAFYALRTV